MIFFSLADLRPRHVRRPSAAHSRFGGEVHAPPYIKVERENRPSAAIWLYSHHFIGRARHKLKRARHLRSIYPASV